MPTRWRVSLASVCLHALSLLQLYTTINATMKLPANSIHTAFTTHLQWYVHSLQQHVLSKQESSTHVTANDPAPEQSSAGNDCVCMTLTVVMQQVCIENAYSLVMPIKYALA